jgi:hypothetical protein
MLGFPRPLGGTRLFSPRNECSDGVKRRCEHRGITGLYVPCGQCLLISFARSRLRQLGGHDSPSSSKPHAAAVDCRPTLGPWLISNSNSSEANGGCGCSLALSERRDSRAAKWPAGLQPISCIVQAFVVALEWCPWNYTTITLSSTMALPCDHSLLSSTFLMLETSTVVVTWNFAEAASRWMPWAPDCWPWSEH